MELDELKAAWTALDNRLKKNEGLRESIVLEMMQTKAGKIVNRFVAWEIVSVVVLLLTIPLIIYHFDKTSGRNWAQDTALLFTLAICFVYPFWGVFKIHGLMKFDLSKDVGNNIFCVNKYRIQMGYDKKILYCFVGPVLVVLGVFTYATMKATLPLWTLLMSMFIVAGLVCYWSYKYYNKGIDTILRSLDEIRELKEE
jgi:hypothetical protein